MTKFAIVCILLSFSLGLGQTAGGAHPDVATVVRRMKSEAWSDRRSAFEEAVQLLTSKQPSPPEADQLRLGIIQLLARENNIKTAASDENEGEIQSEYHSGLISYAADLKDERAIPALLGCRDDGGNSH